MVVASGWLLLTWIGMPPTFRICVNGTTLFQLPLQCLNKIYLVVYSFHRIQVDECDTCL